MNRLIFYRLRKGMTQTEVARHIDVDPSAVSRWEHGKNPPLKKYRKKLAKLYGCTEEALMSPLEFADEVPF